MSYVKEPIENQKIGKVLKIQIKVTKGIFPIEIEIAMNADLVSHDSIKRLITGKQRDYVEYIAITKWNSTKLSRLQK